MARILLDQEAIATFCRKHHIRRLSMFGSALRERPGSTPLVAALEIILEREQ